ncbi:MAG: DUF5615 family PIN-like protein [Algoriphagus sp.]
MVGPLLFDQNTSFRIVKEILPLFPGSKQVREVGLEGKQDREVWSWAKLNGYSLVSFDSDFAHLSLLFGFPPNVIWLRFGNSSTSKIAAVLTQKNKEIQIFQKNEAEGILKVESAL